MDWQLAGRQALVSGGTSGIGRGIAEALAAAGCGVVAAGVAASGLPAPEGAARFEEVLCDVTSAEQVAALAARVPRLDILVNAAGIILREGREFDPEQFARVLDVNLTGMLRLATACRPQLQASRGAIVNLASMLSFFGSGFVPAYSASKGGVAQLTKSLAIAWAADGIRVNAVAPGWITTPLTEPLYSDAARSEPILRRTPLGRWGTPADVAGAVLFLCSPAAAFITGAILPVDGGYSCA